MGWQGQQLKMVETISGAFTEPSSLCCLLSASAITQAVLPHALLMLLLLFLYSMNVICKMFRPGQASVCRRSRL